MKDASRIARTDLRIAWETGMGRCRLFHRWEHVADHGVYRYERCRRCGKRRAFKIYGAHGVLDRTWLETGEWHVWGPPPPGLLRAVAALHRMARMGVDSE